MSVDDNWRNWGIGWFHVARGEEIGPMSGVTWGWGDRLGKLNRKADVKALWEEENRIVSMSS